MLFVGAGVSFLSRNMEDENLPDGASLVDILLEQPRGKGSKHPLDRIADHVVRNKGVDFVYDLLKRKLTVKSVDSKLTVLYDLPWRRIYTTNYDNAIETAIRGARAISRITLENETADAGPGSIIHLNGSILDVSPASLQSGLTLTEYSYATSKLLDSEWFKFFLRDIRSARAIIFVGYSLSDLDIQRALITEEAFVRKSFFFISPSADQLEIDAISDYGALVPGGIDTLVSEIELVSSDYDGVRFSSAFIALAEVSPSSMMDSGTLHAQKLTDQLVYGRLPESEVLHDENVFGSQPFLVLRRQDQTAIDALRRGPWRDILYIGELASGKTASALNLAAHLIDEGYRVFYASKGATLADELRKLAAKREKICVVFEHYISFSEEIREYVSKRPDLHRVIMTERAVTHDLISGFIDKTRHLGPTFEVRLDRIEQSDVPEFEALVNFGGFWGDRSGASESARQRLITTQLESSLYKLLLEIIKSEKVQSEIRSLLSPMVEDRKVMKLFICSFIVNVLGFRFSINDWQTVFDGQWVRRVMRQYTEQVRHFLSLQGDTIFPRAGVLSSHILKTFVDDDIVRESLAGR